MIMRTDGLSSFCGVLQPHKGFQLSGLSHLGISRVGRSQLQNLTRRASAKMVAAVDHVPRSTTGLLQHRSEALRSISAGRCQVGCCKP